jgi:hypothetical protein
MHARNFPERLGQADIAMTLDCYLHASPDLQRQAADTPEAAWRGVG